MDWSPLFISLKTSAAATVIAFFLGILAARSVVKMRGQFRAVMDGIFTLPMVLPPTVLGFILLVIFGRNSPVGKILMSLGIRIVFSWQATVIAAAVVAFPLVYRTVRSAFEQIDPAIINAGRTLGLSEHVIFWKIMMPISLPGAVAGSVLGFARALGEFGATLMLAGNIPGRTATIPVAIFFASEAGNNQLAFLWVGIIFILSFTVIFIVNRLGVRT